MTTSGEYPSRLDDYFLPPTQGDGFWFAGDRAPRLDAEFVLPGTPAAIEDAWLGGDTTLVSELMAGRENYAKRYGVVLSDGLNTYPGPLGCGPETDMSGL